MKVLEFCPVCKQKIVNYYSDTENSHFPVYQECGCGSSLYQKVFDPDGETHTRFPALGIRVEATNWIRKDPTISLEDAVRIVNAAPVIDCPIFSKAIELPCRWEERD